jgi:CRP-like cAMP-binding protein
LYRGDLLFSEGDVADEIIFVMKGSFCLYHDISDKISLPEKLIDKEHQAFNVPYLRYGESSYFGDEDLLRDIDKDASLVQIQKHYRESTGETTDDAETMTIKKRQLVDQLATFPQIRNYMCTIAKEKKNYHRVLLASILIRYNDEQDKKTLIHQRMQDQQITLHMSLKRALKKNKDQKKERE